MIVAQNIQELKTGSPALRALAQLNFDHAARVAADIGVVRDAQEARLKEWREGLIHINDQPT